MLKQPLVLAALVLAVVAAACKPEDVTPEEIKYEADQVCIGHKDAFNCDLDFGALATRAHNLRFNREMGLDYHPKEGLRIRVYLKELKRRYSP